MSSKLDPVLVLNMMAIFGNVRTVSTKLGMNKKSLHVIISRPQNWHLKFAVEAGLYIYRINRARKLCATNTSTEQSVA